MRTRGQGRVDLYVNHETSKVPFPFATRSTPGSAPRRPTRRATSTTRRSAQLILNQDSAGALDGSFVIPSSGGFQRFCSNYLATSKEGFTEDILFTNEESPDYVFRQEELVATADRQTRRRGERRRPRARRQAAGSTTTIYGMGRHNHENNVAIPGFDDLVVLSGDDTFTSGPLTIPTSVAHHRRGSEAGPVAAVLVHRGGHEHLARRQG